jgi:hypothetical protein
MLARAQHASTTLFFNKYKNTLTPHEFTKKPGVQTMQIPLKEKHLF